MSYPPFVPARPKTLPGEPRNLDAPNRVFAADRDSVVRPRDAQRTLESQQRQAEKLPARREQSEPVCTGAR